jgi:hypothetical protein
MNLRRAKRNYGYIKTDHFKTWVVSCIKKTTPEFRKERLDDYEQRRVSLHTWVNVASMEEIIAIMTKLNYPMMIFGSNLDAKGIFTRRKVKKVFVVEKNINKIIDDAAEDMFFAIAPRELCKMAALYSQILNGAFYVPNRDVKTSMQIIKRGAKGLYGKKVLDEEYDNFNEFIKFVSNFFFSKIDPTLKEIDFAIIFYLAANDDKPMRTEILYEVFGQTQQYHTITRSIIRIKKYGYIDFFGLKKVRKGAQYSLTEKGWTFVGQKLKELLKDINFVEIIETHSKQKYGKQVEVQNV